MTDGMDRDFPYLAEVSFKGQYLKEGLRLALLPMPSEVLTLIGQVVAHWGSFEFRFDSVLDALLTDEKRADLRWRRWSFEQRSELFRQTAASLYAEKQPGAYTRFCDLLSEAADIQVQRNVIVHGAYAFTMAPRSNAARFRIEGFHKGKPVTVPLNTETLEPLWHRIAHLDGALYETFQLVGETEGFWPTVADDEFLRLFENADSSVANIKS